MLSAITRCFNVVLESGLVPTSWCVAIICPIYKKNGPRSSSDCYRGISLLSCIGKLFTSAINRRLKDTLEKENVIGPEQAGFRSRHSTTDHAFALHCILAFYLNRHKRVYAAFLDYKKAFDRVDRTYLWLKLISYGIDGKVLNVIRNIYSQAKSCVRTHEGMSEIFRSCTGVRQGENLSPLLFAMYINDFKEFISARCKGLRTLEEEAAREDLDCYAIRGLCVMLYADDTLLLSETEEDLQLALNSTSEYCKQWDIAINPTKSKVVVFSRGKIRKLPKLILDGAELEVTFDFSYLGVCFNYKNTFQKAITKQVQHSSKALYSLLAKCSALNLPFDIQWHLFDHVIVPVLTYGSEVWGVENIKMIDVFHRKFLKQQMHLRKSTPNCMIYGETGQFPLQCKTDARLLYFWVKLHMSEDYRHKLSDTLYHLMRRLSDRGAVRFKWMEEVQQKLDHLGFGGLWHSSQENAPVNPRWFKEAVKQRLRDTYQQQWRSEVENNKHCTYYRMFKETMGIEKTLSMMCKGISIPIFRFRCGNMAFPSNYHLRDDPTKTLACHLCGFAEGDDLHFLFICPILSDTRSLLIHPKYMRRNIPNTVAMKNLLQSKDPDDIHNLSKFLNCINNVL